MSIILETHSNTEALRLSDRFDTDALGDGAKWPCSLTQTTYLLSGVHVAGRQTERERVRKRERKREGGKESGGRGLLL